MIIPSINHHRKRDKVESLAEATMRVRLAQGKPASAESIAAIEVETGLPLSKSFRTFLENHDGAEPDDNIFKVDEKNNSGVRRFIPADEVLWYRKSIEGFPEIRTAYPVAYDSFGNYVFIDEGNGGAVYFWDHEVLDHAAELAPSFDAFLDLLQPFDPSTIELRPGQVKRVWIDPAFLKNLKR
jgi:SMI1-KNR4 cell-wall